LAKWYPISVLLTGRDIITLWVARMVMTGIYNMGAHSPSPGTPGESRGGGDAVGLSTESMKDPHPNPPPAYRERERAIGIPFSHVAINPTILDGRGERMSKSKGNGVDPVDIIELYGADAMRFTLTTMATETQDVRMPVKKLADGRNSSEKFDLGRNFCNKLWNASRFAFANIEQTRGTGFPPVSDAQQRSSGVSPVEPSLHSFDSNSNKEQGEKNGRDARVTGFNSDKEEGDEQNGQDARATLRAEHGRDARGTLVERWILSRLTRTIQDANAALAVYRFDLYAKACYDFFWRDFCDWYIEAAKVQFKDEALKASTAHVIATVLDASLRLMHPMIPFVTEKLWWRLNEVYPDRGIDGWINRAVNARKPGETLSERVITAQWPTVGKFDETAEAVMSHLQELITGIRVARNDYKVNPKQVVTVTILAPECGAAQIEKHREIVEALATCKIAKLASDLPNPPANAAKITAGPCEVYIEGLVDEAAEQQRKAKRREELTKSIAAMMGRLGNAGYIAKAPANLVKQTQDQLAALEAELNSLSL